MLEAYISQAHWFNSEDRKCSIRMHKKDTVRMIRYHSSMHDSNFSLKFKPYLFYIHTFTNKLQYDLVEDLSRL